MDTNDQLPMVPLTEVTISRVLALRFPSADTLDQVISYILDKLEKLRPSLVEKDLTSKIEREMKLNKRIGNDGIIYELFGLVQFAHDANEAFLGILRQLARKDPAFCQRLAPRLVGRKRNHLARQHESVYPGRPDLAHFVIELVPGWYLGTNISNREKILQLRQACEVAGAVAGRDLQIELPNAPSLTAVVAGMNDV